MNTSGISPSFLGLSRSSGQVTHVLLTRSRLCPRPKPGSSLHLHVLSTPPAFVLSQDQTLRERLAWYQSARPEGPSGSTVNQKSVESLADRCVHLRRSSISTGSLMPLPEGKGRAWARSRGQETANRTCC